MAEALSDSEEVALKPRPKRRRILDPSAIVPVPVYSSKVSKSLQLKPMKAILTEQKDTGSVVDESLWSEFSSHNPAAAISTLSDSEEETEHEEKKTQREEVRCCSPSPPDSPVNKHSRQFLKKMSEIDRKLQAVNSLLSPEPQDNRSRRRKKILPPEYDDDVIILNPNNDDDNDDDVVVLSTNSEVQSSPYSSSVREIPLKIRCRTDIHKIPVLSSTPLSDVVEKLSIILKVPPPRLLLLRKDVELPTDSTVSELGLSIADIIECDVMAAEEQSAAVSSGSSITVRLQSKDRNSSQEFTLHKDAPLGSIFSQYTSNLSVINKRKLSFQFDGSKVTANQTPAQLDMEDGDIIEVWT
ncbi:NFATC2-interacting protein isoform X1 [Cheilinus undulatus]|uniref:NFATC2-interacting protein isoform X1 n=1 Tax=Cheilinus undulatus TaxID=241271 RepID=UPI001BD37B5E|nr:NFATC2-interacting protein isoform X1 [Cheilinus undulatus]